MCIMKEVLCLFVLFLSLYVQGLWGSEGSGFFDFLTFCLLTAE